MELRDTADRLFSTPLHATLKASGGTGVGAIRQDPGPTPKSSPTLNPKTKGQNARAICLAKDIGTSSLELTSPDHPKYNV